MNKSARLGLLIALILPLVGYFIVKKFSDEATVLPGKFFPDSVSVRIENGKRMEDTVWHKIPDFTFVNQLGDSVSLNRMRMTDANGMITDNSEGKIVVASFFFTHCPTICPTLTANMKKLQIGITSGKRVGNQTADFVQYISFTVDPARDSVPQLKKWADRFQVDPENWWLLTGEKKKIYDLARDDFKLALVDGEGVDTAFIHTSRFVLIDKHRYVRGYYDGLDTTDLARLSEDIIFLSLEKDKTKKSFLAGKLELLAVVFLLALVGLGLFLWLLKRKK